MLGTSTESQLTLSEEFTQGAELLLTDEQARKVYTAARLQSNQSKRESILAALALGLGKDRIAKAHGVSVHTVIALARISPGEVAGHKERLAAQYTALAELATSRMIEEIAEMPRTSLPILSAIATDKALLLRGEATSISRVERAPAVEDFAAWIEEMPRVGPPAMGSREGERVAKGIADGAALGALGGADRDAGEPSQVSGDVVQVAPAVDMQSTVLPLASEEACAP